MLPLNFNFAQDVIDRLAGHQRAGLFFIDYYGHRRDYTFAEIAEQSARYAAVLRAMGVRQGERVALCNANTQKCIFLLLALARLGAVGVLCGEDLSPAQILSRILAAGATTVVTNRRRRPYIEPLHGQLPSDTRYVLVGESYEGWARMDTLAASARPYTGITTQSMDMAFVFEDGVLDYGSLYEDRSIVIDVLDPGEGDRVWSTLPFGSERWLVFAQAPFWRGAAGVIHEHPFQAMERLNLLHELEVTILCQPAHEYAALLEDGGVETLRLPRLRRCIAIDATDELCAQWQAATRKALTNITSGRLPQKT